MVKFWWRSGSPSGYRDCFRIRHYWEIRKLVSTDCAARRCSARHALAGIAIATMTSLSYRPTTDNNDRRALVEVCTVPALPVTRLIVAEVTTYCSHSITGSSSLRIWRSTVEIRVASIKHLRARRRDGRGAQRNERHDTSP